ncbi:hypothetical protein PFISCL1PPCAC_20358, partial [Pristionchus fissidentatus]
SVAPLSSPLFLPLPHSQPTMAVRNPRELHDLNQYKPGMVLGGRWLLVKLLDEGGFGRVFQVLDQRKTGFYAALKIESVNMDGGSAIKLEKSALMQIHKRGVRSHVPILYRTSKRKNICYMIVTLLGDNLKRLKDKYFHDGYTLRTWSRIAIQVLYSIKVVHDSGFVHRDIKACNFMLGSMLDSKRARMVHILDFGLARQYAFEKKNGQFRARAARPKVDFRGTFCFAAPSMHDAVEQGRKDDIWSFLYLLIDIYAGLPWGRIDNDAQLATMKQNMRDEDLLIRMPSELLPIPKHLRTLGIYSRPNYFLVFQCLEKVMKRCNVTFLDPYEWETKEQAATNKAAILSETPGYLDAGPFFEDDPVNINEGPGTSRKTREESVDDDDDIRPGRNSNSKDDCSKDISMSLKGGASQNNNTHKKLPTRNMSKMSKNSKIMRKKQSKLSIGGKSREDLSNEYSKECTKDDSIEKKKKGSGSKSKEDSIEKKKKGSQTPSPSLTPSPSSHNSSTAPKKPNPKKKNKTVDESPQPPRSVYMSPYGGKY